MPSSKNYKRNYKDEYKKHHSSTKAKKDRANRNKARRKALREGKVHKGDGKDIDHVTHNTASKKTRVMSKKRNRSKNLHKPGEKQRKRKK